ncbi:MAG: SPOR domain-containing protein [Gammaproteobacteria bacterium]|nr:SPOR domain-containing protein [Gammaproteobacteria bacterium]MCP5200761.1 SPOR domain-containing protein [Gammaproteobacteria bacterium]
MAPRDYKHGSSRDKRKPAAVHGSWLSFLSGLGVGLLVAFGVYLWSGQLHLPGGGPGNSPAEAYVEPARPSEPAVELPRPKFDFYKILPEMEVPIPDWELSEREREDRPAPDEELDSGTYLLQVGSFKTHEDADRVKATLALRGISASIQRVVINGQDVWFRVHVGPLSNAEEIRAMRLKLVENDMDFILLRIGDNRAAGTEAGGR